MAMTLKLVRLDDFIDDIDAVDLTSGGYSLALDGYQPVVAADGDSSVTESITINIQSTSVDALATLVQALDAKIKQVGWWINNQDVERYQVWIRVGLNGETNTRQAMILSIKPPEGLPLFNRLIDNNNLLASYTFAIERTPFWEDPHAYPTTTAISNITANNATTGVQLGQTINGDVPARLAKFSFTTTASGRATKAWLGFKTSRFGNPANFVPYWPFSSGQLYAARGVAISNDGLGAPIVTCNFSDTNALEERLYISVSDIAGGNPSDQRGSYLVLMRARVDGGTIVRARIRNAMGIGSLAYNPNYRSRIVISPEVADCYDVFEMGTINIPCKQATSTDDLNAFAIALDLERMSGPGNFYAYGLTLIPLESMIKISSPSNSTMAEYTTVYQKPNGGLVTYQLVAGAIGNTYYTQDVNWALPTNSDKPYLFAASNNIETPYSNYAGFNATYVYIPRWRTLRGTVT